MHPNNCFQQHKAALRPDTRRLPGSAARSLQPLAEALRLQRFEKARFHRSNRKGSLILECVIASVILASCSIALLKWTHSENRLKQQANTHTAAILLADNAIQRLQQATTENATILANEVAQQLSKQQGLSVAITSREFNSSQGTEAARPGIHFTITVSKGDVPITAQHSWNLHPRNEVAAGSGGPNGAIAPTSEKQEGTAND
ncbi:MAG TPA: hypothetical protein DEF45_04775 [Rhodopirellula sp.]|nr:hypothetical protein [Rhodopirellula sp.]